MTLALVYGGEAKLPFFLTRLAARSVQFAVTGAVDTVTVWLLARRNALSPGLHRGHQSAERFIGDGDTVDLHPLVEAADVGGGVEAGFVSGGPEDGGGHGAGAAFAVRACNVDILYIALWVAQFAPASTAMWWCAR